MSQQEENRLTAQLSDDWKNIGQTIDCIKSVHERLPGDGWNSSLACALHDFLSQAKAQVWDLVGLVEKLDALRGPEKG